MSVFVLEYDSDDLKNYCHVVYHVSAANRRSFFVKTRLKA
jgi:hypothetical protein